MAFDPPILPFFRAEELDLTPNRPSNPLQKTRRTNYGRARAGAIVADFRNYRIPGSRSRPALVTLSRRISNHIKVIF